MSTTTKDEKPSLLEDLKNQASAIAIKIKEATEAQLLALHEKLAAAHLEVQSITASIQELSDKPAPKRRGRKPNKSMGTTTKPAMKAKGKKRQRGAVGEAITEFVISKGKAGAHVKDIAKATGNDSKNVTAYFYAQANKKNFKKVAPATFAAIPSK